MKSLLSLGNPTLLLCLLLLTLPATARGGNWTKIPGGYRYTADVWNPSGQIGTWNTAGAYPLLGDGSVWFDSTESLAFWIANINGVPSNCTNCESGDRIDRNSIKAIKVDLFGRDVSVLGLGHLVYLWNQKSDNFHDSKYDDLERSLQHKVVKVQTNITDYISETPRDYYDIFGFQNKRGDYTYYSPGNGDILAVLNGASASQAEIHTLKIDVITGSLPSFVKLAISGPARVDWGSGARYACLANYNDGSSLDVTQDIVWSDGCMRAAIDQSGYLTTESGATGKESCWINARFYDVPVLKLVAIETASAVLSSLAVDGPAEVSEGTGAQYVCMAQYSDGSTRDLTATVAWSLDCNEAVISDTGYLSASAVTSDRSCRITASYSGLSGSRDIMFRDTPVTLSYVVLSGPASLTEGSGAQYAFTAHFSDNTLSDVTGSAFWSADCDAATISDTGYLATVPVTADTVCRIQAAYGGRTSFRNVTIRNIPVVLAAISLTGPDQVPEGTGAQYACLGRYSDGSTGSLTAAAVWSVECDHALISSRGYLITRTVPADQVCRINVAYGGLSASRNITIRDIPAQLTSLSLVGPGQVNEGYSAPYACTARYSDGSSADVTGVAFWSIDCGSATLSASGTLTALPVAADTSCRITALYAGLSSSLDVLVKDLPVPIYIYGFVKTSYGYPLIGVTLAFSNGGGTVQSGMNGFYIHVPPLGWSGTVTPSHEGWTFTPPSRTYDTLTASQVAQDFIAQTPNSRISGYVRTAAGSGIAGAVLTADQGGAATTTDASGHYSLEVGPNWSGTVTCTMDGYVFTPATWRYGPFSGEISLQDRIGYPPATPVIMGTLRKASGEAIAGARITFSGNAGFAYTDGSGFYLRQVPTGWSGTATPTAWGYVFTPASRTYAEVTSHQVGQDYEAIPGINPWISGLVRDIPQGTPLSGVTLVFSNGGGIATTQPDGWYRHDVPYSWSGTVAPFLACRTFDPPSRSYDNVTAPPDYGYFNATVSKQRISGYLRTESGQGISAIELKGLPNKTVTDKNGYYSGEALCGWTGSIVPVASCHALTRSRIDYNGLKENRTEQNFTSLAYEGRLHVDSRVAVSGNGRSWAGAFRTIQEALDAACEPASVEIWVAKGTYSIGAAIAINKAVALYGGFRGDETDRSRRDWAKNPTVLDGQGQNGIFVLSADATIDGFTFKNGRVQYYGGALWIKKGTSTVANSLFQGNRAGYGGAIYADAGAVPTILNSTFSGNHADMYGGAFFASKIATIKNCVFYNNRAEVGGGAMSEWGSSLAVINSTFSGNSAGSSYGGGAVESVESSSLFANCIFWNDSAVQGKEILMGYGTKSIVRYSAIDQEGFAGLNGNIRANPDFADQPGGDLRLIRTSPCIDAGINDPVLLPPTDLRGFSRTADGDGDGTATVDMGAHEYYLGSDCLTGDFNCDRVVNLADVVLALQILSHSPGSWPLIGIAGALLDSGKIGLAEAVYILQQVAGLR